MYIVIVLFGMNGSLHHPLLIFVVPSYCFIPIRDIVAGIMKAFWLMLTALTMKVANDNFSSMHGIQAVNFNQSSKCGFCRSLAATTELHDGHSLCHSPGFVAVGWSVVTSSS